jgi:hypothetical protein
MESCPDTKWLIRGGSRIYGTPLEQIILNRDWDDYGCRKSIEIHLCKRLHLQIRQRLMHIILRCTLFFPPIDLFDLLDHAPSATIKSIGDFNIKINEEMLKQKDRKLCSWVVPFTTDTVATGQE